ncbi:DUF3667 domain-containing protein [Saccharicrinis sp. FJH54]|uniref:DUF3667 domain-containing protein n=1 Tax=Saccharicrinis sp. FJH54 TaxID=3344665 RepID=UPI0035D40026
MSELKDPGRCRNCNSELYGNYCSNCGQPQELKRINGHYVLSEIGSVLSFEKGILYTIKELILRPGVNIRKFIGEDRNRLVKPIVFIIATSLIYTIFQQLLHFEDGYVNVSMDGETAAGTIFEWVSAHYGYSNILMALFIALWIRLFFRKYKYNFFEILILLCFIMGIGMLIFTLSGIMDTLIPFKIRDKGYFIGFLYITWGIGQFFDKKKIMNYVKGLFSYLLGMITFSIVAIALGFLIDALNK